MSFVMRATCSTMMRAFSRHVRRAERPACHLPGAGLDDVERRSELVREARREPPDGGEAVGVPELRERAHLRVGLRPLALARIAETLAHSVHLVTELRDLVAAADRDAVREIPLADAASLRHERRERSPDQRQAEKRGHEARGDGDEERREAGAAQHLGADRGVTGERLRHFDRRGRRRREVNPDIGEDPPGSLVVAIDHDDVLVRLEPCQPGAATRGAASPGARPGRARPAGRRRCAGAGAPRRRARAHEPLRRAATRRGWRGEGHGPSPPRARRCPTPSGPARCVPPASRTPSRRR